ncbi:TetR/AcrR family transcriptional regulator [Paenactinomyces guangxiensis]|uniref:TetR/AcrR family transcriptional regulator n=1 Tax=Paenactinomyces guangxiensis TaxID=1490290 RepID=A0A7W2AAN9_9BACL|nr:TetR/AcrR family transcriptional regulator [Paenactinomyces guangxiensis]MBA4496457.1 TetR/AcrR family transcriptional regulator [Paenactinomyces guangxiensis]MBH8593573.1 TetR/AcrR family transcriptional regulator [Paenactinomyces guangxiensis]
MVKFNREQVLQTARTLFVEESYCSVTIRKVARALGYSHGTLYYHFKDKAALMHEILQRDFTKMRAEIVRQNRESDDPLQRLQTILNTFIRFDVTHPHHYHLMFIERDPDYEQYHMKESRESIQLFLQYISQTFWLFTNDSS